MQKPFFSRSRRWQPYAIPFIAVAIAFIVKSLLSSLITHESPFLLFFAAVLGSAYFGSKSSGIIAVGLSAAVVDYFFLDPFYSFSITELGQGLRMILFILESGTVSLTVIALKSARSNAESNRLQVLQQQEILRQSNLNLEQQVAARTQDLLNLNTQLRQKVIESEQIQRALEQSEERLQLALEASGDGIWDWNIATGQIYFSSQWLRMLGYQSEEMADSISTWERLMHPEDHTWVMEIFHAQLADASPLPYNFSYRLRTKGGDWKWVTNYGKIVARDWQQQPLRMVGIHRDVNAQKRAEASLLESEARLSSFYDSTNYLMGIFDVIDDEILNRYVNKVTYLFMGLTPEQINNHVTHEMGVPSEISELWIQQCRESERCQQPIQFEHAYSGPTGTVWLSVTVNLLDGSTGRFSFIAEDITERKHIEQALQDSEARYRAIVETQTELICRFQPDGVLLFVNDAYCRYFHKPSHELIGQVFLPLIPPEDQAQVAQNLATLSTQTPSIAHEHRVILANGEVRWMHWTNLAFFDPNGTLSFLQGTGTDITDRKNAELQIIESLHEKEILLKEVHHRVKNNLQVICSLLNLQARNQDHSTMTQQFKEAQNRVRSMAMVHEKLYQSDNFSRVDLYPYVNELIKYLFRAYARDQMQIIPRVEIAPKLSLVMENAIPCGLIIQELVSNALKYAFNPGESGEIIVQAVENADGQIVLSVRDDGKGVPENLLSAAPKTLGLRLVQDLTTQIEGKLDLNSKAGSCFTITFAQRKNTQSLH